MKVLLSIRPEFASQILAGKKKYEYRRIIFKTPVERVIIYATSPTKQIVGDFEIEDILFDDLDVLWAKTRHHAGISKEYFYSYFSKKDKGYAIKIGNASKFKTPFSLEHFCTVHPPQSFSYIR